MWDDLGNRAFHHDMFNLENKINITDYDSLLQAARLQAEPQRLLFVFLQVSLPKDHNEADKSNFQSGQGGALQPLMCVDKTADELSDFATLVEESEELKQDWQVVLVASLSGKNGVAPSSKEAKAPMKKMADTVQFGGDLSKYMAFSKSGEPIRFN